MKTELSAIVAMFGLATILVLGAFIARAFMQEPPASSHGLVVPELTISPVVPGPRKLDLVLDADGLADARTRYDRVCVSANLRGPLSPLRCARVDDLITTVRRIGVLKEWP